METVTGDESTVDHARIPKALRQGFAISSEMGWCASLCSSISQKHLPELIDQSRHSIKTFAKSKKYVTAEIQDSASTPVFFGEHWTHVFTHFTSSV